MPLDAIVQEIVNYSTDNKFEELLGILSSHATTSVLKAHVGSLLEAYKSLDPALHSLGCLFLLDAYATSNAPNSLETSFLDVVTGFIKVCNGEQVRLAPVQLSRLCTSLRNFGVRIGQAKHCIQPLLLATGLLCIKPGLITSIHADLFLVCIISKCYSAVKDMLDNDVIHCIDPGIAPITATDILLYFYYGGLLSTGRRQYKQASELFLMAVTLPTGVTNAITVAALKKLILVSFIHGGEPLLKLPKHTSQPVLKALKSDCGPYTELVKIAMTSKDATAGSEIYNFVDSKADLWNADGNYGLIKLILDRIPQRRILALSRLYYTLELPRLAKIIGFENIKVVERKLMRMAETETNFHPSLSHRELGGVVEFSSDENCFTTGLTMSRLHELTSTCMELATSLSELDHSISCSKAYLSRSELTKGPVFNTQMSSDDFGGDELMTAAQL